MLPIAADCSLCPMAAELGDKSAEQNLQLLMSNPSHSSIQKSPIWPAQAF